MSDDESSPTFQSEEAISFKEETESVPNASVITEHQAERQAEQAKNQAEPSKHSTIALTPLEKKFILERLSIVLAPKQFYGKAIKVKRIRLCEKENQGRQDGEMWVAMPLSSQKPIKTRADFTALPEKHFYPRLQLEPSFSRKISDTLYETALLLATAHGGQMRFASELCDGHEQIEHCESCFVASTSTILFHSDAQVTPVATLDVVWEGFPSGPSENHRRDEQLTVFDPQERRSVSKTYESIEHDLEFRLKSLDKTLSLLVDKHNQVVVLSKRRLENTTAQFDLLEAALAARKKEAVSNLQQADSRAEHAITHDILRCHEASRATRAALQLLRGDTKTIGSAQLAIISRALDRVEENGSLSLREEAPPKIAIENLLGEISKLGEQVEGRPRLSTPKSDVPQLQQTSSIQFGENAKAQWNSSGATCLFDCPLHSLLTNTKSIQWRLRIDEPGDWVAVGVGVGGPIQSWVDGEVYDSGHLWVVPRGAPRVLQFDVVVGQQQNAKLVILDAHGKRLDDGRIPRWNAKRTSYPQVSFGRIQGRVTMLDPPHAS